MINPRNLPDNQFWIFGEKRERAYSIVIFMYVYGKLKN